MEFNSEGEVLYEDQLAAARIAAASSKDIVIFVHGWDKTTGTAENDYQDFLCRLYWNGVDSQYLEASRTIVLGVFWPSTVFRNYPDFPLLKPLSFYTIRDRADNLAKNGIRKRLLPAVLDAIEGSGEKRLHIVGHSFGGRMLVWAVSEYYQARISGHLSRTVQTANFVLLLPAIEPGRGKLDLLQDILALELGMNKLDVAYGKPLRPNAADIESSIESFRVFVVHSEHDWANRFLFPLSQLLSLKAPYCSIGACGEPFTPTINIDQSGNIVEMVRNESRVWNVRADSIIYSHSDIYKGRVAGMVWKLVTEKELPQLTR